MFSGAQPCEIALEVFRLHFRQTDLLLLSLDPALGARSFEKFGRGADYILVDYERLFLAAHKDRDNAVVVVAAVR